jgi:hypothetical protein
MPSTGILCPLRRVLKGTLAGFIGPPSGKAGGPRPRKPRLARSVPRAALHFRKQTKL